MRLLSRSSALGCVLLAILFRPMHAEEARPSAPAKDATADQSVEPKFLSHIRRVTFGFVKAGEGYFSPDGKTIIYQAVTEEYPFYQIYTQPLEEGAKAKRVSTGRGRTTCSNFSPDGKKILFASSHLDPKLSETEAAARKQQEEDRRNKT